MDQPGYEEAAAAVMKMTGTELLVYLDKNYGRNNLPHYCTKEFFIKNNSSNLVSMMALALCALAICASIASVRPDAMTDSDTDTNAEQATLSAPAILSVALPPNARLRLDVDARDADILGMVKSLLRGKQRDGSQ